ncbi:MAG: ATP-binding cassette domain-containing protein [Rhodothermales bacterium]|nr:ATP-binding cassette domain-containing protein [Rhodothermales bacterium]MBO6779272.1 ATP-binding cassette domain-containing protein [Rhodothermales bacterium]
MSLVLDGLFYSVRELTILKGVYLEVRPGRVCGLIGRNGCGKSTALKVAAGQIRANSGITRIGDLRLHRLQRSKRFRHVAYLPQDPMLPPHLPAGKLARTAGVEHPLLDRVHKQRVIELSGGERRLLTLLIVLSLGRPYVLLDEPFSGVEPLIIDQMIEAIRAAAVRGAGILVTDHYHQYVTATCDDAWLMVSGQCRPLEPPFPDALRAAGYLRG